MVSQRLRHTIRLCKKGPLYNANSNNTQSRPGETQNAFPDRLHALSLHFLSLSKSGLALPCHALPCPVPHCFHILFLVCTS